MFFRMIKGTLTRQKGKMLLIAFTIALGTSLATAMINTVLDVGDKVNQELKTYGANIIVKSKNASLLSDLYDVQGENEEKLSNAYLIEDELGRIKTIFWTFNIMDFAPFLDTSVTVNDEVVTVMGTWFNHHLELATGETMDAGVRSMRSWWDIPQGVWMDEASKENAVMVGTTLATRLGITVGDQLTLQGLYSNEPVEVVGIFDAGGEEDEQIYAKLDLVQKLAHLDGKVSSVEVSALTTPDNELAIRAAKNPKALSNADYETWYCTAYVSAICYQIQEVLTDSVASAVRQVADSEGAILEKTKLLMILITILSLIGSALGISNLVTASVMERSQEIGLLKAIGARDGAITRLIMTAILITAFVGGVVGYFVGLAFAQLIGQTVFGASIEVNVMVIPIVAVLISLVTLLGSLPAIRMVLRLDPATVLHGTKA